MMIRRRVSTTQQKPLSNYPAPLRAAARSVCGCTPYSGVAAGAPLKPQLKSLTPFFVVLL